MPSLALFTVRFPTLVASAALLSGPLFAPNEARAGSFPPLPPVQPQQQSPGHGPSAHAAEAAWESECPADLELLLERSFAEDAHLQVGERVHLGSQPDRVGCPAMVAGIYEPKADPSKLTAELPRVILHLPHLARLLGRVGEADRFAIRTWPGTDEESLRRSLAAQLTGAQVVHTDEVIGRASTTFEVVRRFHRAIGLITLTAGGAFLACIMILKIQERRTPIAAMRLIGTSRRTLVAWLVLEAALVSAFGGLLGVAIGQLASAIINRYYQWTYDTTLVFSIVTPDILFRALGLAVLLGLAAGGVATLRLLSVHPLEEAGR